MRMMLTAFDKRLINRKNDELYLAHRQEGDHNYFTVLTIPSFFGKYFINVVK